MSIQRVLVEDGLKRIEEKRNFSSLVDSPQIPIIRLCGTHDAIDSMIIEEAGFEGLWLSSFEAHAFCRLPDADILTISDYSDICNKISDRTNLPILVDGDAGGGSPINTIRMVREYQKNGASGICIEDNKYPKRCSFYNGVKRELEDPKYHACKIKAACDNRLNEDFWIVARTEALIVGYSMDNAIERCSIYAEAGADAILIHHKGDSGDPVFEFGNKFNKIYPDIPLVSVPTTYNSVTEQQLVNNNFSVVIYANYGIRSSILAMKKTFDLIAKNNTLSVANDEVVEMSEVFRLIGVEDLKNNEKKYSTE